MTCDRRRFSRIPFQTRASLHFPDGDFDVELEEISLKGALVRPRSPLPVPLGSDGTLTVTLDDTSSAIRMAITLIHGEGRRFGLACREIDLDSATHLRRLVELNVGDEAILRRELSALAGLDLDRGS